MDEKIIASKEQKRLALLTTIAVFVLMIINTFFALYRGKHFSALVPVSVALCGAAAVLTIVVLILTIKDYKKLTEKKRSIIYSVGIFLLCGLEIFMCVSAVSEIYARRSAENSAVLFIKDKYGIEAEGDYNRTFSYNGESWTTVDMTADGKKFRFERYTDKDGNTIFADSYQLDEIKQAIFDEVSRVYPNGVRRDIGVYSSDFIGDPVIERYFDGTNLDEVLDGQHGGVTVDFAETEFDLEDPLFEKLGEWNIKPYFTSFDTTEHLEDFIKTERLGIVDLGNNYAKYAHYITDSVVYEYGKSGEKGKVIHKSYDIKSNDEFDYLFVGIYEHIGGAEKIEKFFAKYNEGEKVSKPISKVYIRDSYGSGFYYIFYPLEKLNGVSAENIGLAWLDNSTGVSNNRGVESASICGDYAVFTLPYHADEFMLVVSE